MTFNLDADSFFSNGNIMTFHLDSDSFNKIENVWVNHKITKKGIFINIKYQSKDTNFIDFLNLPLSISSLIHTYLFDIKKINLFLRLFIVTTPVQQECFYLYWQLESSNVCNIDTYQKKIEDRNKMLERYRHKLFYFNSISNKMKNLQNEIYDFINNEILEKNDKYDKYEINF